MPTLKNWDLRSQTWWLRWPIPTSSSTECYCSRPSPRRASSLPVGRRASSEKPSSCCSLVEAPDVRARCFAVQRPESAANTNKHPRPLGPGVFEENRSVSVAVVMPVAVVGLFGRLLDDGRLGGQHHACHRCGIAQRGPGGPDRGGDAVS